MDEAQKRFLLLSVERYLDALAPKPNDITNILLRFEGKKLRQVDLDRHLSRPD